MQPGRHHRLSEPLEHSEYETRCRAFRLSRRDQYDFAYVLEATPCWFPILRESGNCQDDALDMVSKTLTGRAVISWAEGKRPPTIVAAVAAGRRRTRRGGVPIHCEDQSRSMSSGT